ncbi:MAG: ABC transporter substrate-binding protein [Deltaproteobacteria bacterium]|nr:ABC transporter substrate-binding protein [Deltaproteobacteria bacterium]
MKPLLHADLKIVDIIYHYPQTRSVFEAHGLGALVSADGIRALAPFLSLSAALRIRCIDISHFLSLLRDAAGADVRLDAPGLESVAHQGDLTLLALMPCGLKMPFSRAITGFLEQLRHERNLSIRYAVEGNLNQEISYYNYIDTIETAGELPDIIVSADFNAFYGHRFYKRFVATGQFTGYGRFDPGRNFIAAGIVDPRGEYAVLGVNPLVVVANLDEVGDRPLPVRWEDVLDPQWENSLTLRGGNDFFCHAVLLPIYQKFGTAGLKQLALNVLRGLHPAQMVDRIDSGAPGALYVMPEFFAQRVKNQKRIRIIWPEDGALASPVTLQVKTSRIEALRPVLDYLTGNELARVLVGARFPVPHADINGEVQDRPLRWLGWDYLRRNDLSALNAEIDRNFLPRVRCV